MNTYIMVWKNTNKTLIEGEKIINEKLDVNEKAKEYAKKQYEDICKNRPNKNLTVEEQANEIQLEFINYLKKVMKTGNLEYE